MKSYKIPLNHHFPLVFTLEIHHSPPNLDSPAAQTRWRRTRNCWCLDQRQRYGWDIHSLCLWSVWENMGNIWKYVIMSMMDFMMSKYICYHVMWMVGYMHIYMQHVRNKSDVPVNHQTFRLGKHCIPATLMVLFLVLNTSW